jgi:outer membrane lipoprotein-sorting protein
MREQRRREPAVLLVCTIVGVCASLLLHAAAAGPPQSRDLFDEIYSRGRGVERSLKTVTARFTETTTSSLLSRPLVARGTLAVERPSKIVLRYSDPEPRTVFIDQDRLTLVWPSHAIHQQTDIAAARRRIDKYFLDKSPEELRRTFTITATEADDRAGTWRITMVPTRKQIQQGLARLDLWIDRTSMLLAAMRMTFPNADTKLMVFESVVVNGPVDPKMFSTDDARD